MIYVASLTTICHFLYSSLLKDRYDKSIFIDRNRSLGWIEYSITASVMMYTVTSIVNITNVNILINNFINIFLTISFGFASDTTQSKRLKKIFYTLGFIPFTYSWIQVLDYFTYNFKKYVNKLKDLEKNISDTQKEKVLVIKILNNF